ncbi:hypothetical protein B566_EDAN018105 [Ephemera danica]|nr:hypothetical protein B566_EDAN018105 [Ephemera danica]
MGASLSSGTLPAGLTLAQAMEKWITQTGFPVIVATRDYDAETVKLSQSQFLLPPHKTVGTPTWNVPIFWITEKDSNPSTRNLHWLQPDVPDTNEIKLPSVTDEQWLLINKDQAGFYRVNYDQKNWQLLSESFLNLTSVSRAMLLDDALNLARGGRLDYVTALDVTELLPNETEFAPWSAALNGFSYLYDRLSNDTESREVIEKYILEKLTYIYDYIGGFDIAPAEPHTRLLMKQLILQWACRVGHVTCIRKADDLFNSWILSTTSAIKTDLRRVSYCTGIQQGGSTDFMRLGDKYDTTSTDPITPDNARIVYALGCANDTELLREYLTNSLDTSGRIKTIGRQVFTAVCQNPIGVQIAFNFLITHWYQASLLWPPTTLCLPPSDEGVLEVSKAFSEDLAPKLNTPEQLKQLKALLEFNTLGKVREGVELAIGTLEDTLVWQENHRDEVIGAMGGNRRPPISAASPINIPVILLFFALFIKLKM